MFDVGFWELSIIAVVGLLVLGPERLPRAARTAGLWIRKARQQIATTSAEIERELDLEEVRQAQRDMRRLKSSLSDPTRVQRELEGRPAADVRDPEPPAPE